MEAFKNKMIFVDTTARVYSRKPHNLGRFYVDRADPIVRKPHWKRNADLNVLIKTNNIVTLNSLNTAKSWNRIL